jgi:anti-sigma B factor antagonist
VETAIGVFTSRDRAEKAIKELLHSHVPEELIIFLTHSESEAMALGKEISTVAGGFTGGAVGLGAGMVAASMALIPGVGQVFALGVGAAAVLGLLGTKTGATVGKGTGIPAPVANEKSSADAHLFLEALKSGRSLVVVRTDSPEIAKVAVGILDRATPPLQERSTTKMQTTVRQASPYVTAVDVKGRIVVGEDTIMLRETLQRVIGSGNNQVILVLREVEHIDSSGIGELVRAHTAIRKVHGQLKIVDPSPKVVEMLHMTMLHKVLDVHPSEAAAVKSFDKPSSASANA